MNGMIGLLRERIVGPLYSVRLRFEWNICPQWVTITIPDIRARSRALAAAKAIVYAHDEVEAGWDRVVIEDVTLIFPEAIDPPLRIGVSAVGQP